VELNKTQVAAVA